MRRCGCTWALLLVLCGLYGCGPSLRMPRQSGDGIALRLLDRNLETLQFALFVLEDENTLSGSGGLDARNNTVSWSLTLNDAEVSQLHKAIRNAGWLKGEAKGESDAAPGPRMLIIRVGGKEGSQAFTIEAVGLKFGPETTAVLDLLSAFSRRRFKDTLDLLPSSGDSGRGR